MLAAIFCRRSRTTGVNTGVITSTQRSEILRANNSLIHPGSYLSIAHRLGRGRAKPSVLDFRSSRELFSLPRSPSAASICLICQVFSQMLLKHSTIVC